MLHGMPELIPFDPKEVPAEGFFMVCDEWRTENPNTRYVEMAPGKAHYFIDGREVEYAEMIAEAKRRGIDVAEESH